MASIGSLTAQSLDPGRSFNWIFLVELVVCGILTLFFLFYFNRLFATLVSYGIRAYTWHKLHVYVDIQALQISLLGGRIFFKGIRYHGENETILIHHGYITWNYWLRAVKQADCLRCDDNDRHPSNGSDKERGNASPLSGTKLAAKETGAIKAAQDLPPRISVSVSGFEWFIYNRSPAYETIAASQTFQSGRQDAQAHRDGLRQSSDSDTIRKEPFEGDETGTKRREQPQTQPSPESITAEFPAFANSDRRRQSSQSSQNQVLGSANPLPALEVTRSDSSAAQSDRGSAAAKSPLILTLFPILIQCQKGAIVIGNENIRTILTTSFERSRGQIDASSASIRDIYRQVFDFEVIHPVVRIKPNPDYRQPQQAAALNKINKPTSVQGKRSWWKVNWRFRQRKRKVIHSLRNLMPYFRSSVESFRSSSLSEKNNVGGGNWPNEVPGESRWLGLSRYLDENERDDHEGWSNVEYARFSQVVDCPSVHLSFYWDVPGTVKDDPSSSGPMEDINQAKPPAYGLDLTVRGGMINYGPWADRARAEIQSVFFPNSYQDGVPVNPLSIGAPRQSTVLSINVHIENETTLRIPTRETSKDGLWKGRAGALHGASGMKQQTDNKHTRKKKEEKNLLGPDVRPFGWFAISVLPNSTCTYNMDMIARKEGYHNDLELDLKGTNMTTSVNHALLWKCGPQKIACNLSNPLGWNSFHKWTFDVRSHGMELFLLRDHVFLLIDLINDFTSSPPGDFLTFVPFLYQIKLSFTDVRLYLNANDSNIIDNPCEVDENTFLILHGETLDAIVDIPLEKYAPSENSIAFRAEARNAQLDVTTPIWNTVHTFASDMSTATLKAFSMDGRYNYWSSTSPTLTDSLFLNLQGSSPRIYLLGSLIRYCMKLKDNYFGDDIHFRTLEEYQATLFRQTGSNTQLEEFKNKKDSDLDVILSVTFEEACVLLPANIYSRKENLRLDFLLVEADVRFTNYYMDIEALFTPFEAAFECVHTEDNEIDNHVSQTQAFVDGISIYGHRLFGSAPSEPTYVCNWDFDVGKLTGECSTDFVRILFQAIRSFSFTFSDDENVLPHNVPVLHDVTFLRAKVDNINLCFVLDETAIPFKARGVELAFNDFAGRNFSERLHVHVPDIQLAAVDHKSAVRHRGHRESAVPTYAVLKLSLSLKMVERKRNFSLERNLQQQHIHFHDQRTHRTSWLLHNPALLPQRHEQMKATRPNPPAMPVPNMPEPLAREDHTLQSDLRTGTRNQRQKTTFRLGYKHSMSSMGSSRPSSSLRSQKGPMKTTVHRAYQVPEHLSRLRSPNVIQNHENGVRLTDTAARKQRLEADEKVPANLQSSVTYSNSWSSPYFPLLNTVPDTKDLPKAPYNANNGNSAMKAGSHHGVAVETVEDLDDDSSTVHTMFVIGLGPAVRGFATPRFFATVAALLKALQPGQPTDLVDDLQIDTVTRILKIVKAGKELGQSTDICIRVPFAYLRVINSQSPAPNSAHGADADQYDLQVEKAIITARSGSKENAVHSAATEKRLRLHLVMRRASVEVHDRSSHLLNAKAAARVSLEELVLWVASDGRAVGKFQQRSLDVTSWGSRIEYLVSLIKRTVDMSEFVVNQFSQMGPANRIQSLVYHLTNIADEFPDPVFLTRPSYVLRIADHHLRLHDSWKIVSRLRHMLQSLDSDQRASLFRRLATSEASLPSNAEALVLASFDKWRSWDLAHVRKSLVMEVIWGRAQQAETPTFQDKDILFELMLGKALFVLDPGPKENKVKIHEMSATLSMTHRPSYNLSGKKNDVGQIQVVTIESYCSLFGMHLNWELVELIRDTMDVFAPKHEHIEQLSLSPAREERLPPPGLQFHVVVGMDNGEITLDSINTTVAMSASSARGSFLHQAEKDGRKSDSVFLTSHTASARLMDIDKVLLGWFLDQSTLSWSRTSGLDRSRDSTAVQAIAKSETLRFEMREDIHGCLEMANRIIRDEVDSLRDLALQLSANSQSFQESEKGESKERNDIYMALFLEQYTLSIAILPLLTYVISGDVARTSVVPTSSSKIAISFDVKHHSHAFKLRSRDRSSQLSILHMPPINGKVIVSRNMQSTDVNLDTTVDKVRLDARSVRSCVDTINKPEVVRALLDAKKSVQRASSQLNGMFSPQTDMGTKTSEPSMNVLYTADLIFIGLGVHASAPGLKSGSYLAELDFVLGLTTIHLSNRTPEAKLPHELPQFHVALRRISLAIARRSHDDVADYGQLEFSAQVTGKTETDDKTNQVRMYRASSDGFDVTLHPDTAPLVVDIAAHLQERIKSFTLTDEVKRLRSLRRLTIAGLTEAPAITATSDEDNAEEQTASSNLFDSIYSLELKAIKIAWKLDATMVKAPSKAVEDLVFSIQNVTLNTRREGSATLSIGQLLLQMVPKSLETEYRSLNSALMPEVVFKVAYLSTKKDRRLAFQAAIKALDLRLASDFIVPATALQKSLAAAIAELREGSALWAAQPVPNKKETTNLFGSKYLASLLVDADFAGAVVDVQARKEDEERKSVFGILKGDKRSHAGRYNQALQGESATQATLRAPGMALKIEYSDNGRDDPALNAEIKVAASSNVLYPSVVPLIIEISSSIKDIMNEGPKKPMIRRKSEIQTPLPNAMASSKPTNLMGRCKLNLGLWIREQDFSLSCQPIARVAATARFNDIFMAVNTVQSPEQERFFALSMTFNNLQASVQHVYSRESTASFELESIVLSMMNSKHVSNTTGVSAILNVSPMKAAVNAKQLQDFLLFREIWYPNELRRASSTETAGSAGADSQAFAVQRYQQVAAAGAFPWNAVVSIQQLKVEVDLGQSLGKSVFTISQFWASSKKASDFEQNLCIGLDKVSIECTGRMSGFVELQNFRVRTSIRWPQTFLAIEQTPLVQASLGLDHFRVKAAFDYQPFAIAEISKFEFLMYNVRREHGEGKDHLVANLEGEKVQVFCTTASASQALALYQAVVRLAQEKEVAYEASLRELDKYLRRKSVFPSSTWTAPPAELSNDDKQTIRAPFGLHTDVVVSLRAVNVGAFPSTFFDNQIFKVEATDAQARFAVSVREGKTHSVLGLTLGQLRVALSHVNRADTQALGEVSVSDIVNRATVSRGGTILKVPRVVATMQTWQSALSNSIDYIFKSTFEGKVDVGWNYSRISFIRGMWSTHSRALAARLGKPLPQSAVQISGGPQLDDQGEGKGQEKITAVVNVPQSRFEYRALEPPIIETPQLRDMGEATPPLEWIGLHRDKLPNLTHQIIIVTLLEVAKEVEDAYSKILGSSQ